MSEDNNGAVSLTAAQKAVAALDLLPEFLDKIEEQREERKRGPGRPISKVGKAAAQAAKRVGVGKTSVEMAIAIQKRDPEVIERMRSGELNVSQGARAVGLTTNSGRGRRNYGLESDERDAVGRAIPLRYYGKGDKWKESVGPLLRYLTGWERRSYEFRHVAPKEARRRLVLIAELETKLSAAKADLEQRAHSATLTIKKG